MAGAQGRSFYRRPLPDDCVDFSSSEGRKMFKESLSDGYLEGYFGLAAQFQTQAEPAYCGLTSLVIALNTLAIDPLRIWKGSWRWYTEEFLDCCAPLDAVQKDGINIHQFACLARCNGASAVIHHADAKHSLEDFRQEIIQACKTAEKVLVVSYCRAGLKQTGTGHFSPLAGYHAASDSVLIMDVARFKYPPHWVTVTQLWHAMADYVDSVTGKPRGYIVLQRSALKPLLMFHFPALYTTSSRNNGVSSCCSDGGCKDSSEKTSSCKASASGCKGVRLLLEMVRDSITPIKAAASTDAGAHNEVAALVDCVVDAYSKAYAAFGPILDTTTPEALPADSPLVGSVAQLQHDIGRTRIFEHVSTNAKVAHLLASKPGDSVPSLLCVLIFMLNAAKASIESELHVSLASAKALFELAELDMVDASPLLMNEVQLLAVQLVDVLAIEQTNEWACS